MRQRSLETGDRRLVQVRVSQTEHARWRTAVGEVAPSFAELVRLAVREYLARRPLAATRTWAERGRGRPHWYGLTGAVAVLRRKGGTLFVVNGEPSVWACADADVPAVCLCGERVTIAPALVSELRVAIGDGTLPAVRVVYDTDRAGRDGARAAVEAMRSAGWADVEALDLVAVLPDVRGADADDLHRRAGEGLAQALAGLPVLGDAVGDPGEPVGILLADVAAESVSWLWSGRLARGKLTILEGRPDEGKTTLALDLAARVSTGAPMPGAAARRPPAGVVIVTAEDGLADTIRPRLEAAGADLHRVLVPRPDEVPSLDEAGLAWLRAACARVTAALVILDPLVALMPGAVDAHRDQDVRRMLRPLRALAEDCGVAILAVRHLRKAAAASAKDAGGGSVGIGAAARIVMLAAPDPEDADRRILARVKGNLAPPWPSLAYHLVAAGATVRVEWGSETTHTAEALLAATADGDEPGALEEAVALIRDVLGDGPVLSSELDRAARAAGVSERTLKRARARLKVQAKKERRGWAVRLPVEATQEGQGVQECHGGPRGPLDPLEEGDAA